MPKRLVVYQNSGALRAAKAIGFGELLKKHGLRAGFSQEYLAEKAHVISETLGGLVDFCALDKDASDDGKIASVVKASPLVSKSPLDLAVALKARSLLLIFDHCEHLIANAVATPPQLLQTCLNMRVLAALRRRSGLIQGGIFAVSRQQEARIKVSSN